jgi:hypothetical protein
MTIIESPHLTTTTQFRFPKSKCRRIRKKWSKQPKNFRTLPDENFYQYENKIICHPIMARQLRKTLQKEQPNVDPQINMPRFG